MLSLIEFLLFDEAVVAEKDLVMVSALPDDSLEALLPSLKPISVCCSYDRVVC